jgi:hypothetical protein
MASCSFLRALCNPGVAAVIERAQAEELFSLCELSPLTGSGMLY